MTQKITSGLSCISSKNPISQSLEFGCFLIQSSVSSSVSKLGTSINSVRNGSIKIRFTYPTNTKEDLTVGKDSDVVWASAIRLANVINSDIETGNYDPKPLAKYSVRESVQTSINKQATEFNRSLENL